MTEAVSACVRAAKRWRDRERKARVAARSMSGFQLQYDGTPDWRTPRLIKRELMKVARELRRPVAEQQESIMDDREHADAIHSAVEALNSAVEAGEQTGLRVDLEIVDYRAMVRQKRQLGVRVYRPVPGPDVLGRRSLQTRRP